MTTHALLRKTPLHGIQKQMGARLVDFHGWELPIQFTSILKEHQAVRSCCGVFDVSHMGRFSVRGPQGLDFLQRVNSNDIGRAQPGHAVYSHMLNDRGGVVDDVIVACLEPQRFMVVVNAGTREKDWAWFEEHSSGLQVELEDQSDLYAMLAVQGPQAEKVLSELGIACEGLPKFGVLQAVHFGQNCIVQRTGYTGEDGFEILMPAEVASRFWEELMTRGRSYGIMPCGLGARDTLRLEAGLLLYGQDIDDDHTPLEANYGWVVKFEKGEFIGRQALLAQQRKSLSRKLTGLRLLESGVPRSGNAVFLGAQELGALCSATYSPTLQTGIGVGYSSRTDLKPGQKISVEIHGRRVPAEIVAMPFYKREKI